MPRQARKKSSTDIYHIIMRGINRQIIFHDDEDYLRFLQTMQKYKEKSEYKIYAYCLMNNHVHILLKVDQEPLEQIMRRICGSYVYWYNSKYQRIGNLFQDRFKSEAIENDRYFLTVLRYIHQNPIKAGIVRRIEDYPWSSMGEYISSPNVLDIDFALGLFHHERRTAVESLYEFCKTINDDVCLGIEDKIKLSDREAMQIIKRVCQVENSIQLQNLDILTRDKYLKELKDKHRLSIRQIARLTGINRGIVLKAGR